MGSISLGTSKFSLHLLAVNNENTEAHYFNLTTAKFCMLTWMPKSVLIALINARMMLLKAVGRAKHCTNFCPLTRVIALATHCKLAFN